MKTKLSALALLMSAVCLVAIGLFTMPFNASAQDGSSSIREWVDNTGTNAFGLSPTNAAGAVGTVPYVRQGTNVYFGLTTNLQYTALGVTNTLVIRNGLVTGKTTP